MTELESLALLIADLNTQVRALQAENAELREALQNPATEDGIQHLREKSSHPKAPNVPWGHGKYCGIDPEVAAQHHNAEMLALPDGCPDCGKTTEDGEHVRGCDWERCEHNLQAMTCDGTPNHD